METRRNETKREKTVRMQQTPRRKRKERAWESDVPNAVQGKDRKKIRDNKINNNKTTLKQLMKENESKRKKKTNVFLTPNSGKRKNTIYTDTHIPNSHKNLAIYTIALI